MRNIFLIFITLFVFGCTPDKPPFFEKGSIVHYKAFPEVRCSVLLNPRISGFKWYYYLMCKNKDNAYSELQDRTAWEWELEND